MRLITREQIRNLKLSAPTIKAMIDEIKPVKTVEKLNIYGNTISEAYYDTDDINNYLQKNLGYAIGFDKLTNERGSWKSECQHIIKHYKRIQFRQIITVMRYLTIKRYLLRKELWKTDLWTNKVFRDIKFALNMLISEGVIKYNSEYKEYRFIKESEAFSETQFTYKLLGEYEPTKRQHYITLLILSLITPVPYKQVWYAKKQLGNIKKSELRYYILTQGLRQALEKVIDVV